MLVSLKVESARLSASLLARNRVRTDNLATIKRSLKRYVHVGIVHGESNLSVSPLPCQRPASRQRCPNTNASLNNAALVPCYNPESRRHPYCRVMDYARVHARECQVVPSAD